MPFKIVKFPKLISIFEEAQFEKSSHTLLILKLTKLFKKTDVEIFTQSFITCLKKILIADSAGQYCADKGLEFAVKFTISVLDLEATEREPLTPPSPDAERFSFELFRFFRESHDVVHINTRRRICLFISKFMLLMSIEAELDMALCDTIVQIMQERIKDRVPIVRIQAVLAIYRLQDVSDQNCPITKMLLNCIETDNSADVRKTALGKISLKHKSILRILLDRINDISDKVRREFYQAVCKLHPQYFSTEQRRNLLYTGLYDNSDTVKKVVKMNLLTSWVKRMDNDIMKFLHLFDLIVISSEFITKILMSILEASQSDKSRETMDNLLDELNLIPHNELSCENAFYWRCYVFFASEEVDERKHYQWNPEKSYDAMSAGLLPDLSVFCEYIKTYYDGVIVDKNMEKWKRKEQEFIFTQLIELCKVYDYGDEVGRRSLSNLCLNLLHEVQIQTIRPVIELYFMLRTDLNDSISKVTNEINNILYPNGVHEETIVNENQSKTASTNLDDNLLPSQENSFRFKIAKLEVRLEEVKDLQEEAVRNEDFVRAQNYKQEMNSIRDEINSIKEIFYHKHSPIVDELTDELEEDRILNPLENLEDEIVLRCVTILNEMLQLSFIKTLTPDLRTLFQDFVLQACQSSSTIISPLATELLGSICLRDKNLAQEYFITFFSLVGNSNICVSALKVLFDLLLCFGPSTFNISNLDDTSKKGDEGSKNSSVNEVDSGSEDLAENEKKKDEEMISGYTFITALIDLLDDEYIEARYTVIHGLCRLMAIGKLKSVKVLTRLIIIWFHPASRDSVEIRDCLNFFFPYFVKRCKWALLLFEEAIIPTMETLFQAPLHNPISEIDQKGVMKVLCEITNPNFVFDENESRDNIHGNLAVLICKTIMELDEQEHVSVLLKGLDFLDFSAIHLSTISTLNNLITKVMRKIKKHGWKKLVLDGAKFQKKLNSAAEIERNIVSPVDKSELEHEE